MKTAAPLCMSILAATLVVGPNAAHATAITLSDLNSAAVVETGPTNAGVQSWFVDGQVQMGGQWFFIGGGGSAAPIEVLGNQLEVLSDTNPFTDPAPDTLALRYGSGGPLLADVTMTLRGSLPGSGASDLAETIMLSNVGRESLDFSFFQFVDFNLGGTPGGDTAQVMNANTVRQTTKGVLAEEVATQAPDVFQVGEAADVLSAIQSGALVAQAGPYSGDNTAFGLQWNIHLDPGQSFLISKDKRIQVPEPASVGLVLMGLAGLGLRARRRS